MSILLAIDLVELYPPGAVDAHGWREQGADPSWTGTGNLQLGPGRSDPRASDGGGAGPSAPASAQGGVLYLPPEAPVTEGCGALVRGNLFLLSSVRLVADPTGGESLTCWAATASSTSTWPGDG